MNNIIFSDCFRFVEICLEKYHHTDNRRGSPQHYIAYMKKGRCKIVSPERSIEVQQGDVFYIPMDLSYQSYWYGDSEIRFLSFGFNFFPDAEHKDFILQRIDCDSTLKQRIAAIPTMKQNIDSRTLGEFYGILAQLCTLMKTEPLGRDERLYRLVRKHIYDNPEARAAELARLCGISETTLYSVCKRASGKTPNGIRQEIVAEKAVMWLSSTDKSVQEISDTLGFSSTSYFRKSLRKETGKTPSEIRKKSVMV